MNRKLHMSLKKYLPGIFLIGFNIGTGSVTAMSKAGADYGMQLLWAVMLSCLFTFFMIYQFGKFTIFSERSFLNAIRRYIHPSMAVFMLVAIGINVSGSIIGVMGIVADVLFEWSRSLYTPGIKPVSWAAGLTLLVILFFFAGNSRVFQKVLLVMVTIMGTAFLINAFILMPSVKELLRGMVPGIPRVSGTGASPALVVASIVGTTLAPIIFIARSVMVRDEGWKQQDLRTQRNDAALSAAMMFLISSAIVISAAGTLYGKGINLEHARDMVSLLRPVAGGVGVGIFVIGITAAGVSSQFPNMLLVPWMIGDFRGKSVNLKARGIRIIAICMVSLGMIVPIFHASPIYVMIASQAIGAILLPLTMVCFIYMRNSKKVMEHKGVPLLENIFLVMILLFSIYISTKALISVF
jgi:manganese transport protein